MTQAICRSRMQRSGGSSESLDLDLVKQSLALRVHSVDDADDIRRPPETPVETAVTVGFVHLMGWMGRERTGRHSMRKARG